MWQEAGRPRTTAKAQQKFRKGLKGKESEESVLRLNRVGKAKGNYPLKLTQRQRETLLQHTQLSQNLTKKLKGADAGTQTILVTWNELHKLQDQIGNGLISARSPHKDRLLAVQSRLVKFFNEHGIFIDDLLEMMPQKPNAASLDRLFQFKITIQGIQPAIWRRIQVPDCTLADLHQYIQAAFGWEDYHLHQFTIGGQCYMQPSPYGDDFGMEFEDESIVFLSELLPTESKKATWNYEYDFGDGWQHEILFEGSPTVDSKSKVPLCLEGERACPPEDCGGTWGYEEYLDAMTDPRHERHQELMEWRGPFNPEAFDAKQATKALRRAVR